MVWDDTRARAALRTLFDAAVAAADPRKVLAAHLPPKPKGRCIVVGCGKSAAVMAAAVEDAWPDVALEGTVVTRYGHNVPTRHIEVIEASHPVPDANSERGARRLLERVRGLGAEDLVLALISGGGSALCAAPAAGLTLADKQAINRALLASGANISEMNCVRKHLSAIKGGRLAAAARPARVVTLAISDVPGDDPAVIASGPTVPDPTTFADARAIIARYGIKPSPAVAARLEQATDETPDSEELPEQRISPDRHTDDGAETDGRDRARPGTRAAGTGRCAGRRVARDGHRAGRHRPQHSHAWPAAGAAGRHAVGRRDHRHAGRRRRPAMAAATPNSCCRLRSHWAVRRASGRSPATPTASTAWTTSPAPSLTPDTLARARAAGLDPRAMLAGHDSHTLFDTIGDAIRTGPTLTNVNDVRAILIA